MNNRYIWQCWADDTIQCETSDECKKLAEQFPDDPKYKRWFQVLDFFEEVPNG